MIYTSLLQGEIAMTPGEKIRQLRKKLKINAQELADTIGVSKATLYRYENGEIEKIPMTALEKIAKKLGCSVLFFSDSYDDSPTNNDMVYVPIVGKVSAGFGSLADQYTEGYELTSPSSLSNDFQYIYLRVSGDSMYPLFMEGDLVLVRCQSCADSGSFAVVMIDELDGVIKKIICGDNFIELISINPMYPPRRFEGKETERIKICGIVKEIKRKF